MKVKIRNKSATNQKVRLIPRSLDADAKLDASHDNTTIHIDPLDGSLYFCLSPVIPAFLTCEGATRSATLWYSGVTAGLIRLEVTIANDNGVKTYIGRVSDYSSFTRVIFDEQGVELYASCGGEISVYNYSGIYQRIVVKSLDGTIPSGVYGNPTAYIDLSELSISFCLAPEVIEAT